MKDVCNMRLGLLDNFEFFTKLVDYKKRGN